MAFVSPPAIAETAELQFPAYTGAVKNTKRLSASNTAACEASGGAADLANVWGFAGGLELGGTNCGTHLPWAKSKQFGVRLKLRRNCLK